MFPFIVCRALSIAVIPKNEISLCLYYDLVVTDIMATRWNVNNVKIFIRKLFGDAWQIFEYQSNRQIPLAFWWIFHSIIWLFINSLVFRVSVDITHRSHIKWQNVLIFYWYFHSKIKTSTTSWTNFLYEIIKSHTRVLRWSAKKWNKVGNNKMWIKCSNSKCQSEQCMYVWKCRTVADVVKVNSVTSKRPDYGLKWL